MNRFESIIHNAIKEGMSDVYITGGHPVVSHRAGKVEFHSAIRWSHQEVDNLVLKLLSSRQLDDLRERKSVDYATSVGQARLRINIFTSARGLSLAIRVLPGAIPTINELNLHPSLHEIATMKYGLVLACGPTGVGKTTTIAAIINDINNTCPSHIVMLENPIEYKFPSRRSFIQQRELGAHMPSFAQGLLDALRENPDVIVVGELREPETMQLTLGAAESGHLVIATMHASTPEEAVYRLCNSAPLEAQNEVRYQLSLVLNMIIVQQLVHVESVGYRVPLLTIVRGTPSIKNIIRENRMNQLNSTIQMSKNEGMFTSERYFDEYLASRKTFFPYSHLFRPAPEDTQDIPYESPLTDEKGEAPPPPASKGRTTKTATEAILIPADLGNHEMEGMLTINEDESLQDLIKKMEK
jgi:twitching motility protein PilT